MNIETETIVNDWTLFTLTNSTNMRVCLLDFGATLTDITVSNRNHQFENVVLSYEDYNDYATKGNYFGSVIGRVAGRIQNASFTIGNEAYSLEKNKGQHHIHGGSQGFHQAIWQARTFQTTDTVGVTFTHTSPDGEGGYPGTVAVSVSYTLTDNNELTIDYSATSDKTTALSLTNHCYFNLSGIGTTTIHNHHVTMNADEFVELGKELIPTGRKITVDGSPFDFRNGRNLADGIHSSSSQNAIASHGYDHYFIFKDNENGEIIVNDEKSGRKMTVHTNQPGVVMYTSNTLKDYFQLNGGASKPYLGVCFETQGSPASLHHEGFPTVLLQANETYEKQTMFAFDYEN